MVEIPRSQIRGGGGQSVALYLYDAFSVRSPLSSLDVVTDVSEPPGVWLFANTQYPVPRTS